MSRINDLCDKLKIEFEEFKNECMFLPSKEIVEDKAYEIAMKNCLTNSFEDIMLQNKNSEYNEEYLDEVFFKTNTLDYLYTKYFNHTIEDRNAHVTDEMIKWLSNYLFIK